LIPAPSRISPPPPPTVATTRRDETPSNIKPSDPYDDIIDLDWLGVQGAARLDEPTRPLTPSHIYFPRIQVTKTPTPPRRTRHHTIPPLVDRFFRFHRPLAGELVASPRKILASDEREPVDGGQAPGQGEERIRSFERKKGNTPRSGGSIAACPMVPSLAARSCIQRRWTWKLDDQRTTNERRAASLPVVRSFRQTDSVRVTVTERVFVRIR